MKWPWSKSQPEQPAAESQPEQRAAENPNYTALWLMQAAQMAKAGSVVALEGLGIVQASYRIVERAFQSIVVQTKAPITIPPALLGVIGRGLIARGEWAGLLDVRSGRIRILPALTDNVYGRTANPETWSYHLTIPAPNGTTSGIYPAAQVIHPREGCLPETPWKGNSSLQLALATGDLAKKIETLAIEEFQSPTGWIIPVPPQGENKEANKQAIQKLQGAVAMPEIGDTLYGETLGSSERWDPRKIGAKPDPELRAMRLQVTESIANAIGVPIGLTTGHEEGTALREDFRRLVHTCIQPLGKLFKYELERVIEEEVMLDYSALNAADITSRARAYQSLTDKKMDGESAAQLTEMGRKGMTFHDPFTKGNDAS